MRWSSCHDALASQLVRRICGREDGCGGRSLPLCEPFRHYAARLRRLLRAARPPIRPIMNEAITRPVSTAGLDEVHAFLERNSDIAAVQLVLTDANGIGRGKNIAREELSALYTQGRNVAGSILGLDVT